MNNSELIKLKNSLPFGSISELSIRTRKSKSLVCQVLKGQKNSNLIIDEANEPPRRKRTRYLSGIYFFSPQAAGNLPKAIKLAKEEKVKSEIRSTEISNL